MNTMKKAPFIFFPFQLFSLNSPTEHMALGKILVSASDVSLDALIQSPLFLCCPPQLIPVGVINCLREYLSVLLPFLKD